MRIHRTYFTAIVPFLNALFHFAYRYLLARIIHFSSIRVVGECVCERLFLREVGARSIYVASWLTSRAIAANWKASTKKKKKKKTHISDAIVMMACWFHFHWSELNCSLHITASFNLKRENYSPQHQHHCKCLYAILHRFIPSTTTIIIFSH